MSEDNGNGNGGPAELSGLVDTLELRFDRSDGTMHIGGKVVNNDTGLDMCLRAARYFETLVRVAAAAQARAQMTSDLAIANISRDLINRR